MKYEELRKYAHNIPIIYSRDIIHKENADPIVVRNQLNRLVKKGYLIKLKRGMYILNEQDRTFPISSLYIANQLYEPSYLSMEFALSFYGIIPERVETFTSITTRKTKTHMNELGHFVYQHIKLQAFRGFRQIKDNKCTVLIAEPEKAVVDFLYFHMNSLSDNPGDQLIQSYRFQNLEELQSTTIIQWAELFDNKKLMRIAQQVCTLIEEE